MMKTEEIHGSKMLPQVSPSQVTAMEDDTARRLSRIWQEQLGIDVVDLDQNFFDLGGDSSLAVRMFSQIEQVFGVKLPLAMLYEAPTIEELARILRAQFT
ncbi:MAG: acyl carrier protein [Candidatus Sulfotelmatobacter sp.]|jgi:acyl carrier protein